MNDGGTKSSADMERAREEELPEELYGELRRLAAHFMVDERSNHTLTPTALVHEVFLRVSGAPVNDASFASHSHFFSAAALAMRRILVDSARKRRALKRGGDKVVVPLNESLVAHAQDQDIESLDDALSALERVHPDLAELVSMRYFAGMTMKQTATALGLSLRTAERNWHFARAWLKTELAKSD